MTLYLIILIFLLLLTLSGTGKQSSPLLFSILLALSLFVGLSDMLGGYDRYIYSDLFERLGSDIRHGRNLTHSILFLQYPKEIGYDLLNLIIALFTTNRYIFILILTLIIYSLIFVSFQRYMINYPFALFLFMGILFFFTFTYLRQMLSVCIVWLSVKYIIERRFIPFLITIIIGFLFHNSALLFLAVWFIPVRRHRLSTILPAMFLCFICGALLDTNNLFDLFGSLSGTEDRTQRYAEDNSGFRLAYVIEAIVILFFLLLRYDRLPSTRAAHVFFNIALCFPAFLLIFCRSENGGRLSWFFIIGLIATLTILYSQTISSASTLALIAVALVLYLRILLQWGILLYPYKTFFTPGHRAGDYIYTKYEYNHRYDHNKLLGL